VVAGATAFKRFFACAYILLKVEAHSWPGKIIAKIKIGVPGPSELHFLISSTILTVKYPRSGVNRNFFGRPVIMIC
jgi:hypothetical protein